jgi:hypothetical protein
VSATILPLLRRCPACEGRGVVVQHASWCRYLALEPGTGRLMGCECGGDRLECACCDGRGRVEPARATVWTHDGLAGLTDGWWTGVRP